MKAAHIKKIEQRLALATEVLLPERTSRGEVEAPGDRLRRLLARLDSDDYEGKGRPESGWRMAAQAVVTLLDTDVPELIEALRQSQGAVRRYCRFCGERRIGLIVASPEDNRSWECRDVDGCDARQEQNKGRRDHEREQLADTGDSHDQARAGGGVDEAPAPDARVAAV